LMLLRQAMNLSKLINFFLHEIKWSTIVSKPIPPPEMAIWGSLVLKCLFYWCRMFWW
jgi:hypothetical protein